MTYVFKVVIVKSGVESLYYTGSKPVEAYEVARLLGDDAWIECVR